MAIDVTVVKAPTEAGLDTVITAQLVGDALADFKIQIVKEGPEWVAFIFKVAP